MFDLPDAKRVRRSDLYTRSQSPSPTTSEPDPELEAQLQSHFAALYGSSLDFAPKITHISQTQVTDEVVEDEAEQEFEFRLFSEPASKGDGKIAEPQKIVLDNGDEEIGDGGFVRSRDPRVWVVRKAEGDRKLGFETMSLSGEEVLRRRSDRAWGLEVPWRVKVLKVVGKKVGSDSGELVIAQNEDEEGKRKRPGKKRRLIWRQRKKKNEESAERRRREKEEKDEAEREKKTRRNREKKVKRKMKEKAKKGELAESGNGDLSKAIEESVSARGDGNKSGSE